MYETPDDAAEYGELAEINEQLDDDEILTDDGEPESPTVTELTNDDFPAYFTERENHLFHSHGNSTYPLPVDGYEIQVGSSISLFSGFSYSLTSEDERYAPNPLQSLRVSLCWTRR